MVERQRQARWGFAYQGELLRILRNCHGFCSRMHATQQPWVPQLLEDQDSVKVNYGTEIKTEIPQADGFICASPGKPR